MNVRKMYWGEKSCLTKTKKKWSELDSLSSDELESQLKSLPPLTRRQMFGLAAAFPLAILSVPYVDFSRLGGGFPKALADDIYPVEDASKKFHNGYNGYSIKDFGTIGYLYGEGGGSQSGYAYNGRVVGYRTPWVEWDMNMKPWGSGSQFLSTAVDFRVHDQFTTELYHHMHGAINAACGSLDEVSGGNAGWQKYSKDDCVYSVYEAVNDYPSGGSQALRIKIDLDDRTAPRIVSGTKTYTPYRNWNGHEGNATVDYYGWKRRHSGQTKYSYMLKCGFYNYFWYNHKTGAGNKGDEWNPPIQYQTGWIEQYSQPIKIKNDLTWSHRIIEVIPTFDANKRMDCTGGKTHSGAGICIWDNYDGTNQNWIVLANSDLARRDTMSMIPVHACNTGRWLDQSGGGPTETPAPAQLCDGNGGRAQAVWLHESNGIYWFFNDCSGMALDRVNAGTINGTGLQFHSNGYCDGEWGNVSHQWKIKDALFRLRPNQLFPMQGLIENGEIEPEMTLSTLNPTLTCLPVNYGDTWQLTYQYAWAKTTEPAPCYREPVEIVGHVKVDGKDNFSEQVGDNLIGSVGQGLPIKMLRLGVKNSTLSGFLKFQAKSLDGAWGNVANGWTWVSGSPIELVKVWLEGDLAKFYKIAVRAHSSAVGWQGWVYDGAIAGAPGRALEGLSVRIEPRNIISSGQDVQSYVTTENDSETYLTCLVRADARMGPTRYRGSVATESIYVQRPKANIKYYVDGEEQYVYFDRPFRDDPYTPPQAAHDAGFKPGCERLDAWYTDEACTKPFVPGTIPGKKYVNLYGKNVVTFEYRTTTPFEGLANTFDLFKQKEQIDQIKWDNVNTLYPVKREYFYGQQLNFNMSVLTLYYIAQRISRTIHPQSGVHLNSAGSDAAISTIRLVKNTVVYVHWPWPIFDGVLDQRDIEDLPEMS